jgi:CDP-glycerol glycerophosphotransferase
MRVVYNSFHGRYSDSPRAVFERLSGRRDLDQLWLMDPEHAAAFPPECRTVDIGSAEARSALTSADMLIANSHTELDWSKTPRTTYAQIWHGTPLKRIHRDVLWAPPGRLDRLDEDVAKWDLLVSPNAESTPRLRSGFRYRGEVLEMGYPRNDALVGGGGDELRATTRSALGLPPDATVILYAPTWRDDEKFGEVADQVAMGLDIARLLASWDPGYRLVVRSHPLMVGHTVVPSHPHVVDASYYPDLRDLFVAADALVTDYSSAMFDFAVTGKPIVLYAYDLERFRQEIRGFYFDPVESAPGPIVETFEELLEALADLPGLRQRHADAYEAFARRFCYLEDGHATDRLLARLGL